MINEPCLTITARQGKGENELCYAGSRGTTGIIITQHKYTQLFEYYQLK